MIKAKKSSKGGAGARKRYEARMNKELLEMKTADPFWTRARANRGEKYL